jgi:hypothetical protein
VLYTSSGADRSSRAVAFISYLGQRCYAVSICKTLWRMGLGASRKTAADPKDALIRVSEYAEAAERAG